MRRNKRAPGKAYYISLDEENLSFGNVVWWTLSYFFCIHVLLNLITLYTKIEGAIDQQRMPIVGSFW